MPPKNQTTKPTQDNDYVVEAPDETSKPRTVLKRALDFFRNPYIWALVILMILGGGIAWYASTSRTDIITINGGPGGSISEEDFIALSQEQAEIDSTNRILNVRANSVFDGAMLVRSSLEVQGQLRVGQELNLNDLVVTGQSTVNNLDISGDLNVQGSTQFTGVTTVQNSLTVSDNLTVTGSGTFAGNLTASSITAGSLNFNGDLTMNGHIITSGPQTNANLVAVGSGGTVSASGNDISGTVNINTGESPAAGILVTVQFGRAYAGTPRVNITPVGAGTGALNWYITRNSSGFSIGTNPAPPAGGNFTFDYFVVQ